MENAQRTRLAIDNIFKLFIYWDKIFDISNEKKKKKKINRHFNKLLFDTPRRASLELA